MELIDPIDILMIDDDQGDIRITMEAVKSSRMANRLHTCSSGEEGLAFLRQEGEFQDEPRPHLILLDLNMPGMSGMEVLEAIRKDPKLEHLPVVILTTSDADADVLSAYKHKANCYVTKPVKFEQFLQIVQQIEDFFVSVVKLPRSN